MQPNDFQSKVLNSNKRITIVTSQPGAGTTTALMMKLAEEAYKSKNNLCFFCTRTSFQALGIGKSFAKSHGKARYSPESSILSFEYKGKKVKIKLTSADSIPDDNYITCIAFDNHIYDKSLREALLISGKVVIADRISNIEYHDSWAYTLGFLSRSDEQPWEKPKWINQVEVIKGYTELNPHLLSDYKDFLYKCRPEDLRDMMRVDF